MTARRAIVAMLVIVAAAGAVIVSLGNRTRTTRSPDEGAGDRTSENARASLRKRPAHGTPSVRRCEHPWLSVAPGMRWDYSFTKQGRTQEIRMTADRIDADGTIEWSVAMIEDAVRERTLRTTCIAEDPIVLPIDVLGSTPGTDVTGPACAYPANLDVGMTLESRVSTELGRVERTCSVVAAGVELRVPGGAFVTSEVAVVERGNIGARQIQTESRVWIAPDVGIVKMRTEGGELQLVRRP